MLGRLLLRFLLLGLQSGEYLLYHLLEWRLLLLLLVYLFFDSLMEACLVLWLLIGLTTFEALLNRSFNDALLPALVRRLTECLLLAFSSLRSGCFSLALVISVD